MRTLHRLILFVLLASCVTQRVAAQSVPLGGFIPFVGFGMTPESKTLSSLDLGDIPFIADPAVSVNQNLLLGGGSPFFDIALFDSGAATHIITQQTDLGFDIDGAGLRGTNTQIIGGATGQILLGINDAAGVYVAGMQDFVSNGPSLDLKPNTNNLRGQTSFATLTAPSEWTLPNIIGLPMAAQHAVSIRNSEPQVFQHDSRTVRTPLVEFMELGTGDQQGVTRRVPLNLRPGIGFVQGPQFVFNLDLDDILTGGGEINVANNPASPSVILDSNGNGGGLFVDVDMSRGASSIDDKGFLFDTGADLTVVSELTAVRLGFDPILDTPDFILQVEGSGGVQGGVPGFYVDELRLDSIGGSFVVHNVPVAVLDVTNPNEPGNIIDGILGTHVFNDRDLVIDANPSVGQGGTGPSLYISDPVTNDKSWASANPSGLWQGGANWTGGAKPGDLDQAKLIANAPGGQQARVQTDQQVFALTVGGAGPGDITLKIESGSLTVFGDTVIQDGGIVQVGASTTLDAPSINIQGGELTGGGDIFVGNGPITGTVRNLAGRIDPTGQLSISGDLANLSDGEIALQIGGSSDSIDVGRFAFLAGELDISLADGFTPAVNDTFTLITAGEGVEGEFESLDLPGGYLWEVDYSATSVTLEVTGVGLVGDFNSDGVVDAGDYAVWRTGLGGAYTQQHYNLWRSNYGKTLSTPATAAVAPEPGAASMLIFWSMILAKFFRRSRCPHSRPIAGIP